MVKKRQIFVVVFRLSIQYILRFYKAILECQLLRDYLQRKQTATHTPKLTQNNAKQILTQKQKQNKPKQQKAPAS